MTGDLMIEVTGDSMAKKADALSARMKEVLRDTGIVVRRPARKGDLRVSGFDDSVSPEEVKAALASAGNCREAEIRMGEARTLPSGMRGVWVQCPVAAAKKIYNSYTGKGAKLWLLINLVEIYNFCTKHLFEKLTLTELP
ncbi:uncharacterized protein LOC109861516 [Pseudomyrmex gracilis]|uniref:uncharacterized protein LOC109861516 n=1 Tax=Pseudomyrmex gracilis TaxID=219809 RepID=UPI0009951CA9|nr:uncharacterized protein LOC109861516 [Pseudomyrmex gracilis]